MGGPARAQALCAYLALAACAGGGAGADAKSPAEARGRGVDLPAAATSFSEAKAEGAGEIAFAYVPAEGFAYRDEEGELTGATVELLRDFASFVERAYEVELRATWVEEPDWGVFYENVRASEGGVFGIGNVTITDERREEIGFSPPYMSNVAVLITHEDTPELDSMDRIAEEFDGLTALVYEGTLHEERLEALRDEKMPELEREPATSNDEIIARVASEPGYFAYIDMYNYARARRAGAALRRHEVGDDASETFGVILPPGSDWEPVIRHFFEAGGEAGGPYAKSERFRDHLRRHLGDELADELIVPDAPAE